MGLEGGGGDDAAGLPVAAPTAAAAAPAPAPPAAIGLLSATTLETMDEGAGVAWRLPRALQEMYPRYRGLFEVQNRGSSVREIAGFSAISDSRSVAL